MAKHPIKVICTIRERLATQFLRFQFLRLLSLLLMLLVVNGPAHAESTASTPQWLQADMSLSDARHLLGRTGFGATPERLAEMLSLTRAEAVQNIVDGLQTQPDVPMPSFVNEPAPQFWTRRAMEQSDKQAFDQARDKEVTELRRWWVNNMVQTSTPQTERLVLFWHDHFATSYHGVDRRSISIARQNQLFRDNATGSYREFLKQLIRDPAMLRYLDNTSNKKRKPNENLARELLELFTLGEGNYDEATVKAAAKALTGFSVSQTKDETFQFNAYHHEFADKTLFGKTGNFDGDALIDLILEQPQAAKFIVTRFWHAFISDEAPPPSFVDKFASQFRRSDYSLLHLYSSLLRSEDFWQSTHRLAMIKSPATLLIGTARSLDYPKTAWTQLPALHSLLGMDLFAPPNVSGWSEGVAFVTPGKLLNRQLALRTLTEVQVDDLSPSSNSMMMQSSKAMLSPSLEVRVAAHLYQGAPEYRVSLLDKSEKTLWQSDTKVVNIGYDTEMFGEMRTREQLSWADVPYDAPQEILTRSHYARVEFVNDAAGKTGDRNLFLESISVDGVEFPSSGASQDSLCPPKNKRMAGNLYCAGHVTIDIATLPSENIKRAEPFTARNASMLWGISNKQRINTIIALEHVRTPTHYFHTLSFQLVSKNEHHLEIWLDDYGCAPSCVQAWPPCSTSENNPSLKTLRFTLKENQKREDGCGYQALSNVEKVHIKDLVNSIFSSVPMLLSYLENSDAYKPERLKSVLQAWDKRKPALEKAIEQSKVNEAGQSFVLNDQYELPESTVIALPEPNITYRDLKSYQTMLDASGISLAHVLIGGVEVNQFPTLQASATQPIEAQLETVLNHPLFQVY